MATVTEGLEQPQAGEKVNTEAGFAAALQTKGIEPDNADVSDTSVSAGLEIVEPAAARDPGTGRFVQKPAADTSHEAEDTSTVVTPVTSDDPEIAGFLAKYKGDVGEALKAAIHAQSLIGRRDEERDALAEKVARLEGLVDGLKVGATPAAPRMSDEDVEEVVAARIAEQGFKAAATEAANLSIQENGDERMLRAVYDQWNLEDPWEANNFLADFRAWQRTQAVETTTPAGDPWVESRKTDEAMNETFASLAKEIGKDVFDAITTVPEGQQNSPLLAALDAQPQAVLDLVASTKPEERLQGARIVADRAMLLAGTLTKPAEVQKVEEPGMPDSVARKLQGAAVATAGLRPVTPAQGGEKTTEEAVKDFKDQILAAETTSVASGLTYGTSK